MNIRIERISEKTFEGFYRCLDEVARERRYLAHLQAPPIEKSREWVRKNIERGIPQYVALVDDQVVGWADISPREREVVRHVGELGMGILKPFRGQGIGRRLLETTLHAAQEYGLERIELNVYASNTRAFALYRKCGFVQEGIKKRGRYADGVYDDVIIMAKLFSPQTNSNQIQVCPITHADRDWIRKYLQERWGSPQMITRGVVHQADELAGFIPLLDGKPVGLLTYYITDAACEIVSLDADLEGRGIGTVLIQAVREQAVVQGCTRLWLITTNDNTDALRFYQKRGFELVAIHRHAVEQARRVKPSIPLIGSHGIPIRDEIELELRLQ